MLRGGCVIWNQNTGNVILNFRNSAVSEKKSGVHFYITPMKHQYFKNIIIAKTLICSAKWHNVIITKSRGYIRLKIFWDKIEINSICHKEKINSDTLMQFHYLLPVKYYSRPSLSGSILLSMAAIDFRKEKGIAQKIRSFEIVMCRLVTRCGNNPIVDVNIDISSLLNALTLMALCIFISRDIHQKVVIHKCHSVIN